MKAFSPRGNRTIGPEEKIQKAIIDALESSGWLVIVMVASEYMSGVPDLYACHEKFGARWIEVKNPLAYQFTPAQMEMFPKLSTHKAGVWVLTSALVDELKKLHQPSNWWHYIK